MPEARSQPKDTLRLEHDELARRLESRPSVEVARRGLALGFGGLMAFGIGWALYTYRYGTVPSELAVRYPAALVAAAIVACTASALLLARAILVLRRSRRMAREEAALFARLRELRRTLGLDP